MKEKFFKIVGGFSLFMASITLLVAIISGFTAANQFFGSADEDIDHPEIKLEQIHSKTGSNKTDADESVSKAESSSEKEDKEYFEKLDSVLSSIINELNEFAKATDQGSVNEKGLEKYLIQNTESMGRDDYLIFLDNLSEASEDLNDKAEEIASLKPEDEKYIQWSKDFLPWFITTYTKEYNKELQRIQDEKMEDKLSQASSLVTAGIAASAFLIFVFFTLILLMVQIEKNTRRT